MEVKIGVTHAARELSIDVEMAAPEIEDALATAIEGGGVFSLTDAKGRRVVVPVDKVAYLDITASIAGQVGFRS